MSSAGHSRRDLFSLGLSRVGRRLDTAAATRATPPPAPVAPTLESLRARWDAARTPEGDALWAEVGDDLRRMVDEVAPGVDSVTSVFGPQSTPAARQAINALFEAAAPGRIVAFSVWATGGVGQLLKVASDLDPLPPGVPGAWGWGSRERLRQDLDHHADEIHYRRGELLVGGSSLAEATERLAAGVPALAAALERHGEQASARFAPIVRNHARAGGVWTEDDAPVEAPVPYLLVVARPRVT